MPPEEPKKEHRVPCNDCGKGYYKPANEILGRIYGTCDVCGHNKQLNKGKNEQNSRKFDRKKVK